MPRSPMRCTASWRGRSKRMSSITRLGHKGQAKQGGKKALGRHARGRRKKREPGRGHYDKDRPAIIAWVSRQGAVVLQATRDFTVEFIPLSFWYDTPLISRYSDRRHDPWQVYRRGARPPSNIGQTY